MTLKNIFSSLVFLAFISSSVSFAKIHGSHSSKKSRAVKIAKLVVSPLSSSPVKVVEPGPQDADDESVGPFEGAGIALDDAGAPEAGEIELSLSMNTEGIRHGDNTLTRSAEVGYGVTVLGRPAELAVAQEFSIDKSTDEDGNPTRSSAYGKPTVGVKVNVYNNDETAVSAAMGAEYSKDHVAIPLIISKEFGAIAIVANAEYEKPLGVEIDEEGTPEEAPELSVGVGIGRRLNSKTTMMMDVTRTSEAANLGADKVVVVDVGLFRKVRKNMNVFITAGRTVGSTPDGQAKYVTVAGIQKVLLPAALAVEMRHQLCI